MKREIIESILRHGDKKLIAKRLETTYVVRYVPLGGEHMRGIGLANGIAEQFKTDDMRHDVYGVAYVMWHAVEDGAKAKSIKRIIRRLMARHWVKTRRLRK